MRQKRRFRPGARRCRIACRAGARVLEFYLGLQGPAVAEIIAQIDHGVRDVHPGVTLPGMRGCGGIPVYVVAEEIAGIGGFAVSAHGQAGLRLGPGLGGKGCRRPFNYFFFLPFSLAKLLFFESGV